MALGIPRLVDAAAPELVPRLRDDRRTGRLRALEVAVDVVDVDLQRLRHAADAHRALPAVSSGRPQMDEAVAELHPGERPARPREACLGALAEPEGATEPVDGLRHVFIGERRNDPRRVPESGVGHDGVVLRAAFTFQYRAYPVTGCACSAGRCRVMDRPGQI